MNIGRILPCATFVLVLAMSGCDSESGNAPAASTETEADDSESDEREDDEESNLADRLARESGSRVVVSPRATLYRDATGDEEAWRNEGKPVVMQFEALEEGRAKLTTNPDGGRSAFSGTMGLSDFRLTVYVAPADLADVNRTSVALSPADGVSVTVHPGALAEVGDENVELGARQMVWRTDQLDAAEVGKRYDPAPALEKDVATWTRLDADQLPDVIADSLRNDVANMHIREADGDAVVETRGVTVRFGGERADEVLELRSGGETVDTGIGPTGDPKDPEFEAGTAVYWSDGSRAGEAVEDLDDVHSEFVRQKLEEKGERVCARYDLDPDLPGAPQSGANAVLCFRPDEETEEDETQ